MLTLDHNQFLPIEKLNAISDQDAENYSDALPFAHGVYDDVFAPELLEKVIEEFAT